MKNKHKNSYSDQEDQFQVSRKKQTITKNQERASMNFQQAFPSSSQFYLNKNYQNQSKLQKGSNEFDQMFQENNIKKYNQSTNNTEHYQQQFNAISFGKGDNLLDLDQQQKDKDDPLKSKPKYFQFLKDRIIEIQGPQLISQGVMTSYKLYKIKSKKLQENKSKIVLNKQSENNSQWQTCVARRFSDFEYLQSKLIQNYGGHIIPLLPQKNFWASLNLQGKNFIDLRKKSLLKYINRLLSHQVLRTCQQVRIFLFLNDGKFSSAKGQYFSHVKAQDKIKSIASNAYAYGVDFISKFTQNKKAVTIINPTQEDLQLARYQVHVNQLARVINYLRNMVENTAKQMQMINKIRKVFNKKQNQKQLKIIDKQSAKLLQQFQDLCKFIQSCSDALIRRKQLRLTLDQLHKQEDKIAKRIKSNPRSQEIDLLRNKIQKTQNQCQKWTKTLMYQLSKSVYLGRSMLQNFIKKYEEFKNLCYLNIQSVEEPSN